MGLPDRMEEQICNEVNGIKCYQTQTIERFLIVAVEKAMEDMVPVTAYGTIRAPSQRNPHHKPTAISCC